LITEDGDQLLGVCCVCDLEQAATGARVRHVMHDERLWVEANADADEALALMESHQVTCLPVLERGRLSGVITLHALQRFGVMGAEEERCSACGSTEHVACVRCGRRRARGLCMDCVRKSEPPEPGWELELGGGD
jgi:Mg/Co/Ni transporter MgtE